MASPSQIELLDLLLAGRNSSQETTSEVFVLKTLNFILGDQSNLIEHCLVIADDPLNTIREIRTVTADRSFWKVPSSSRGKDYLCLKSYCPCRSYYEQSKTASGPVICKHLAAIRVAEALGRIQLQIVSDSLFVQMMCGGDTGGNGSERDVDNAVVVHSSRVATFL